MKFQVASLMFFSGIVCGRPHSNAIASRELAGQGQLDMSNDFFEVRVNGKFDLFFIKFHCICISHSLE
jgi:hypothetical protein